jgi:hypothetical protein
MTYAQTLLAFLQLLQTAIPVATATVAQVEAAFDAVINHPDHPANVALPTVVPAAQAPAAS